MKVPFTNLQAQHAPLKEQIGRAMDEVIDSGTFAGGAFVQKFETDFATYCGTRHAVGVGTGTDALWLTMAAMGIGPGDEVITVPMSFIATAEAISQTGATPVFVDIDERTFTMDPTKLRSALTRRTKAIIPVHLFGHPADMAPIKHFAKEHQLAVIEDAAQAHGAEYDGRKVGSLGDAGCFSFYPGKNLGAIGEGGAVVTDDSILADKVRILRDHGQSRKSHHSVIGWNSRMDGIQGAILSLKLPFLDLHNQIRVQHAKYYASALAHLFEITLPTKAARVNHVFHIYAIQSDERARLMDIMTQRGVGFGIHYPVPIHLQPAYEHLGYGRGSFPVSESLSEKILSLPMSAELTSDQAEIVVEVLNVALSDHLLEC